MNKAKLRKQHKSGIKISKTRKIKLDFLVLNKLKFLEKLKNKNILAFLPLKSEVNLFKIITKIRQNNNIFVPFMQGKSFKLVKYRLPLEKKNFCIKEPKNSFAKAPRVDIALIPVIGVDVKLKRVGFGKGMYDRFFEKLPYKTIMIFLQIQENYTSCEISNSHDIQADLYITPKINILRGKYDRNIIRFGCFDNRHRNWLSYIKKDKRRKL